MTIKHILLAVAACMLSACSNPNAIELDVKIPGLKDGVFIVKEFGKSVFGENIKNGECNIKGLLEAPGFYELDIVNSNAKHQEDKSFEIYLEPGKYTFKTRAGKLRSYPEIITTSETQQELNAYYTLYDEMMRVGMAQWKNKNVKKTTEGYAYKMFEKEAKRDTLKYQILEKFIETHPQSALTAHFMAQQKYNENPKMYAELYGRLSPGAKNSSDGKEIKENLDHDIKLLPGQKAPTINGKTFDGKTFAAITVDKKLFLIDFWKAANAFSRTNHDEIRQIYNDYKDKGLQVISVSLDKKPLWWATAVKDDKLPWPQMCDLKGNDSPNITNWNISTIPSYYLVDEQWHIITHDLPSLKSVKLEVSQYFEHHPQ